MFIQTNESVLLASMSDIWDHSVFSYKNETKCSQHKHIILLKKKNKTDVLEGRNSCNTKLM